MKNNYTVINHKGNKYIVAETSNKIPFLFDFKDLEKINNRTIYRLDNGYF
jgi:hypothetical protein